MSTSGKDYDVKDIGLADRGLLSSYRLAAVLLGSELEAQDAVQDAAAVAWERFADLRDQERFEAWIMTEVEKGAALPGLYPANAETKARYEATKRK